MGRVEIPVLDGWRGCAILALLIGHFIRPEIGLQTGRLGVELFFVLSGRLMAEVLYVQRSALGPWAWRRVARLVPTLWIFLAAMTVAGGFGVNWRVPLDEALSGGAFISNYTVGGLATEQVEHVWSLCVEAQCYLILAGFAWLGRNRSETFIAVLLLTTAGIAMANGAIQTWIGQADYYSVYWRTDTRGASIFVAAGLYLLLRRAKTPWLFAVAAPAGLLLQFEFVPDPVKYSAGTIALSLAIVGAPHAHRVIKSFLGWGPIRWFGLASYSLYLWQQPFEASHRPWWWTLPLAIAVGVASYYFVERPARRWLTSVANHARFQRLRRPPAA